MRMFNFAKRCAKEILRDPLTMFFGLGFPVVLLLLLSAIQANIPVPLFAIERLAPGITIFGLAFMSLFAATLVARDRETAFLQRLYTSPLKASDFILGYMLPLLPIGILQAVICYLVGFALGLKPDINILYAILLLVPMTVFHIALGLLCGSMMNTKQVGGICGALLTNLSAWLSGVWFDLELVGGTFRKIADCLPFIHAVELEKAAVMGDFSAQALGHLWPVCVYGLLVTLAAVLMFLRQMKRQ